MGVRHTYGTAGATGGGFSAQSGTLQPAFEESALHTRPDFCWQRRSAKTWRDRNQWFASWPTSTVNLVGGGDGWGTDATSQVGPAGYEPFSCDGDGCKHTKFILGRCEDASGAAAANSTVKSYRTSDDALSGQDTSRNDGTYIVPAIYGSVAHYVVAYKPGAPDITGATLNTLTPTNIDGT